MTGSPEGAPRSAEERNVGAAPDPLRLIALRTEPLSVDEVLRAVADPHSGGTAVFVGTVRAEDAGRDVTALGYTCHPTALSGLREVAAEVAAAHDVRRVAAVHRVGELAVGEIAVVVAVAAAHRGEAFVAARRLIDELKARVPIWKHQRFADGGDEWVGTP